MKKLWPVLMVLISLPLLAAEPAGQVVDFVGKGWITPAGQKPQPVALRQPVQLGDEIKTEADGAIKLLFRDDTLLVVKENSRVLVTEFLFDPEAKRRKISLDAFLGKIRVTVSRHFGKAWGVDVKTPTAVAGIRGTDLGSVIDTLKTSFYCFECREPVSVYERQHPSESAVLSTGQAIDIQAGQAAREQNKYAIPEDIKDRIEILFDIQGGSAEEKAKESAVESAKTLMEQVTIAKETEQTYVETTPSTADQEAEKLSTGSQATSGTKLIIKLP